MRIITKIQNVKSAINSKGLKDHSRRHSQLKKLISKNISISQMIENSRYKIAYSSFCPAPGFLSTKNTPRYQKLADKMIKMENDHLISEKIKNWKKSIFNPLKDKHGTSPSKHKQIKPFKNKTYNDSMSHDSFKNLEEGDHEKEKDVKVSEASIHSQNIKIEENNDQSKFQKE